MFNERLETFIKAEGLNQATFASKLNIGRASISHIISGRNKPGYDFFCSLLKTYPNINIFWLLFGEGKMYNTTESYKSENVVVQQTSESGLSDNLEVDDNKYSENLFEQHSDIQGESSSSNEIQTSEEVMNLNSISQISENKILNAKNQRIKQIIVFYTDNSFEEFKPF